MNVLKPHVSLNVANIAVAVAFYEAACGMPTLTTASSLTRKKSGCCG